jgi:hypothetical protein
MKFALGEMYRGTWHIKDHVPILQRLRWGQLPFANLRYANSPGDRLDWECGERTTIEEFKLFDCDWEGNHLRPRDIRPRKASELNVGNKDIWWDSIELREVRILYVGRTTEPCWVDLFGILVSPARFPIIMLRSEEGIRYTYQIGF